MKLTRKQILKSGAIAGGACLALKLGADLFHEATFQDGYEYHFLTPTDCFILTALIPATLAGALPTKATELQSALLETVHDLDRAILLLPQLTQQEIRNDLLDTLDGNFIIRQIARVPGDWNDAQAVANFLNDWRQSYNEFLIGNQLRHGYIALLQLVQAVWYANPRSWDLTGYDGPPELY